MALSWFVTQCCTVQVFIGIGHARDYGTGLQCNTCENEALDVDNFAPIPNALGPITTGCLPAIVVIRAACQLLWQPLDLEHYITVHMQSAVVILFHFLLHYLQHNRLCLLFL